MINTVLSAAGKFRIMMNTVLSTVDKYIKHCTQLSQCVPGMATEDRRRAVTVISSGSSSIPWSSSRIMAVLMARLTSVDICFSFFSPPVILSAKSKIWLQHTHEGYPTDQWLLKTLGLLSCFTNQPQSTKKLSMLTFVSANIYD